MNTHSQLPNIDLRLEDYSSEPKSCSLRPLSRGKDRTSGGNIIPLCSHSLFTETCQQQPTPCSTRIHTHTHTQSLCCTSVRPKCSFSGRPIFQLCIVQAEHLDLIQMNYCSHSRSFTKTQLHQVDALIV